MTKQLTEMCTEASVQPVDSDYGTWSSSSSDRYFELKNSSISDVDFWYSSTSNPSSSYLCSNQTDETTDSSSQDGYQSPVRQRTNRWRGIRMGITIDYNVIKSYGERHRKRLAAAAATFEALSFDSNKCFLQYDTPIEATNIPNSDDCLSTMDTNEKSRINYSYSDAKNDGFQTSSIQLKNSRSTITLTGRNGPSIPQDIINNAKILTCKIAIVGGRKTGKSTLVKRQILNEVFFGESDDETEPIFQGQNDRSNEGIVSRFMIDILDNDNTEQVILRADAIMLVYSITDKKSFVDVNAYYRAIMTAKKHMSPVVLIGTKVDVEKKKRKVTAFEGQTLARRFNCPFVEVSAKTNEQVHQAFVELMRLVDKQYARIRRFNRSLAPILL